MSTTVETPIRRDGLRHPLPAGLLDRVTEVVTSGTGEYETTADQAEVGVSFEAHAADRASAVNLLARRMAEIEPTLVRDGVHLRQRSMHVGDRWNGRRRAGSSAQQYLRLRITALGMLDDLLADLFTAQPEGFDGPHWSLADETAAVREAQRRAVADARARAEVYAEAVGGRLGVLLRLADETAERPYPVHGARMLAAGVERGVGPDAVQQLGLVPEQVTARATCVTTWSLLD